MEDLSRDMAENLKGAGHKHNHETAKSWTLLLVGDLGKIVSVRLSRVSLVCFLCIFAVVCTFAIVTSMTHISLRLKNRTLQDKLNRITSELLAANEAGEASRVRLMLLEGKEPSVKKAQPGEQLPVASPPPPEAKTEPVKKANTGKTPALTDKKDQPAGEKQKRSAFVTAEASKTPGVASKKTDETPSRQDRTEENADSESEELTLLDEDSDDEHRNDEDDNVENDPGTSFSAHDLLVDKLEIWKHEGGQAIKFQFSLKNVGDSGRKISGYTFVVLKPGEGSSEVARGSPWTPLEDGQPTIYKRGQYFSIVRFKYVRGTVPQIQDVERFKTATVYVYAESGDLLTEKVFDIDEILKS